MKFVRSLFLLWVVWLAVPVAQAQNTPARTRHEAAKGSMLDEEPLPPVTGGAVSCTDGSAAGFPCRNIDLLSFLPIDHMGGQSPDGKVSTYLNDIWGWTDPESGREIALVGRTDGTSFVDVTDPENPVYLGNLPSTNSTSSVWRDIKVLDHYALIVADNIPHGLQIFDLHQLREVTNPPVEFEAIVDSSMFMEAHNIVVNESSRFAYAVGGDGACPGLLMIDLTDPENPREAGCYADTRTGIRGNGYTHDAQCITYDGPDRDYTGREICFGSNETDLQITDVTDPEHPVTIEIATYPGAAYTHQGWLTPDRRYFFQDDELDERSRTDEEGRTETRTMIWDVADLDQPEFVGLYYGSTHSIDHNMYIVGDRAFQANYTSGLRVLDLSDPESPAEVGYFDTYLATDTTIFEGAWSNYPFFESGIVVVSSIGEGLFVLRPGAMSGDVPDETPPSTFQLSAPYPNPFTEDAEVRLSVDRPQQVRLAVYDVQGRLIRELFSGFLAEPGTYTYQVDADALASGTYVIRVEGASGTQSVSATVVR